LTCHDRTVEVEAEAPVGSEAHREEKEAEVAAGREVLKKTKSLAVNQVLSRLPTIYTRFW